MPEIPDFANLHMYVGWAAMLLGAVSGAFLGLFFHRDSWSGGYAAYRRRMLRLGHISFFGIGFLNFLFAMTMSMVQIATPHATIASLGFLVAVVSMPLTCFLTAWKKPLRHLFPIPVIAVLAGILPLLIGWPQS